MTSTYDSVCATIKAALDAVYASKNHTHSGYLTTSDIYDGLDSSATNKALSAKQGKALNDMIGSAISYIVGSGS